MSNDTTHDLVALKAEQKQLRNQRKTLEDRQKDLTRRLREVGDGPIQQKLMRDRQLVDDELTNTRTRLSEIAEAIAPLDERDADERDTFNQATLNGPRLLSRGCLTSAAKRLP
jgi:chromosome segregation ATPase